MGRGAGFRGVASRSLVALLLGGAGCGNASTPSAPLNSPDGGVGVEGGPDIAVDGARGVADAARPVDSGLVVQPGDILRNDPSDVALIPGTARCLSLSLLHQDGTSTAIVPLPSELGVVAANASLVGPTPDGECKSGGLLGQAPGATAVALSLTSGGQTVKTTIAVTVKPYVMTASLVALTESADVRVGGYAYYLGGVRYAVKDSGGHVVNGSFGEPLWSRIELVSQRPSIVATLKSTGRGLGWRLDGVADGSTTLSLSYTLPGHELSTNAIPVRAHANANLVAASAVATMYPDSFPPPMSQPIHLPDRCFGAELFGRYTDPSDTSSFVGPILAGVTWSTSGALTQQVVGGLDRFCMPTMGDGTLRGCAVGSCAHLDVVQYAAGDIASVAVVLTDSAPVVASPVASGGQRACLPIKITATFSNGMVADVTSRPTLKLWFTNGSGEGWHRGLQSDPMDVTGFPASDSAGRPCVDTVAFGMLPHGAVSRTLFAGYGGVSTTAPVEVQITLP